MVLADKEHCTAELFDHTVNKTPFDLLTPMTNTPQQQKQLLRIPAEAFTERWAGLATAQRPYPFSKHLAKAVFNGLDGDIRVIDDTILVTFYNAPNTDLLRQHYQNLPDKLAQENVSPKILWLYDFKLEFRFK